MYKQKLSFKNRHGVELAGLLQLPADQHPHSFALFAHCFTCSKNLKAVQSISRGLTKEGFGVLSFDFTGLGQSKGDFAATNFSSNVDDLIDACSYLQEHHQAPTVLVGHSLGGAAVLKAAYQSDAVRAVATIGAPYAPEHVLHLIDGGRETIEEKGEAEVKIGNRPFRIQKQFIEDLESVNSKQYIKAMNAALLVMHSPQDDTVDIDNAQQIYKMAQHPKSFISLDGADHLLMKKQEDGEYAGKVIGEWAKRYVDIPKEQPLSTDKDVAVRLDEGFTSEVRIGQHGLVADEPESVGGNNYGPTPFDLLTASLGTCTAMTLRMYADRKEWALEGVEVHLNFDKVHKDACDCDKVEADKAGKIALINREIELTGDLSEEQRQKLLEIANKCPVHRTIDRCVKVESKLI